MSHGKQFTLFTSVRPANGYKIALVLNALGLEYESRYLTFEEIKGAEHVKHNPNGRIPTLIDHSKGDLTIWESGAIMLYLVENYDKEHKISVSSPSEKAVLNQWLFFQTSGQGPYFGQAAWFRHNHSEKVPSAIERYANETRRVLGVLESVLSKQEYLVGGKLTVADIAFLPYNNALGPVLGEDFKFEEEFPVTAAWHRKVAASPGVKEGLEERARLIAEDKRKKAEEANA